MEEDPEEAPRRESFTWDFEAVTARMQQQPMSEYYDFKLTSRDEAVMGRLEGLDMQPDFARTVQDARLGGTQAAMQHADDEPFMMKLIRAAGGVLQEDKPAMARTHAGSITLQEACMKYDVKAADDHIRSAGEADFDAEDSEGTSCLGHAAGAGGIAEARLLPSQKADPSVCDASGSSAVFRAAAYGRKEVLACQVKGMRLRPLRTSRGTPPSSSSSRAGRCKGFRD